MEVAVYGDVGQHPMKSIIVQVLKGLLSQFSENVIDIEAVPQGHLIAVHNKDVPGVVGRVGTALGDGAVNIGRIHLSRDKDRGEAFSLINVDSEPPAKILDALRAIPGVASVRHIRL